ncbi:MAG TPA: hypothetical protein VIS96_02435 [Terrimicrobiaceae bacterium]
MDPNEILEEIRERKQREADERTDRERAKRAEAERERMAVLERARVNSVKLEEIREILDKMANRLQGFSSRSESSKALVEGEEFVQEARLSVAKYPRDLVLGMAISLSSPETFILVASGNREQGMIHFSFLHKDVSGPTAALPTREINHAEIEKIFLDFVRWFGELAF